MTDQRKRLVLIDGHALAYRMFYAISQDLSTRTGEPTNATLGFSRMLVDLITADDAPDYLAISFDVGKTFRHDLFDDYKGTREKMPDELRTQISRIHQVVEAFNIPIMEVDGYEADDVLGTVAQLANEEGVEVTILTGDRDLLQLVNELTFVRLPVRGLSDTEDFGPQEVLAKYGVSADQFVDYKALIGDKSDNIPGVYGIGEKTAEKLLQEFGSLDGIYDNIDKITSKRTSTALAEHRDEAYLSQRLARIVVDIPLDFDLEACRTRDFDPEKIAPLFQELEFTSLMKRLRLGIEEVVAADGQQLALFGTAPAEKAYSGKPAETRVTIVNDDHSLAALVDILKKATLIAIDTETTDTDQMKAALVGISLAVKAGEAYYIPLDHKIGDPEQLPTDVVMSRLRGPLTDPLIQKTGHNIKYDAIVLARHGLEVAPLSFDSMIGEGILRAGDSFGKVGLKNMAFTHLGVEMTEITELIGKGRSQITFDLVPVDLAAPYAGADADMTLRLKPIVEERLHKESLFSLFSEIEMPLVPVVMEMERTGVTVDTARLAVMSKEMGAQLEKLHTQIYAITGYTFNPNSPAQLGKALFEDLRLPSQNIRKTASGQYSTAADVLEALAPIDSTGIVSLILEMRETEKLRSTYVEALPLLVNRETGRIHSSFNQVGTATGRLSSSDPNLQNIPIRSEQGRKIREAFIAAPGTLWIGADYSQVELRILAHLSGDEALRQAFIEGQDIHAATAAAVNNIPLDKVTPTLRSFAKAVNFGLIYGMGAFRLARDSELTLAESEDFIEAYFERYPRIKSYLDGTKKQAADQGYVETMFGRRRYFPELASSSSGYQAAIRRRAAEREAINMPIQGTAADIIKIAMIQLHRALRERDMETKIILQIHDELILEAPESEADEVARLMKDVMENAVSLTVPLQADVHMGKRWDELK